MLAKKKRIANAILYTRMLTMLRSQLFNYTNLHVYFFKRSKIYMRFKVFMLLLYFTVLNVPNTDFLQLIAFPLDYFLSYCDNTISRLN